VVQGFILPTACKIFCICLPQNYGRFRHMTCNWRRVFNCQLAKTVVLHRSSPLDTERSLLVK